MKGVITEQRASLGIRGKNLLWTPYLRSTGWPSSKRWSLRSSSSWLSGSPRHPRHRSWSWCSRHRHSRFPHSTVCWLCRMLENDSIVFWNKKMISIWHLQAMKRCRQVWSRWTTISKFPSHSWSFDWMKKPRRNQINQQPQMKKHPKNL